MLFLPQHSTVPLGRRPQELALPQVTCTKSPGGAEASLKLLEPQQTAEPSFWIWEQGEGERGRSERVRGALARRLLTPHAWYSPVDTCVNKPLGGVGFLSPQHLMVSSRETAHEKKCPHDTWTKVPEGWFSCPKSSEPQHFSGPPNGIPGRCSTAHVWK
jgi:hypothetical protein